MKILVVDDERAVRESLRRALELEGYEIELAADGDRLHAVLRLADLYLKGGWVHGSMLPQDGDQSACCFAARSRG